MTHPWKIIWYIVADARMFGGPIPATAQNQYNKVSEDLKSMREQDKLVSFHHFKWMFLQKCFHYFTQMQYF